MIDAEKFPFCSELDVVETTLYAVAGESTEVRIEVLRSVRHGHYHTHVYLKEDVTIQPTYPQDRNGFVKDPESVSTWIIWGDFPWVQEKSAEDAIASTLSFLRERTRSRPAA